MISLFSKLRRSAVPLLAVAVAGILFSACLKNKDGDNTDVPAAGLMSFNLAPEQASVVITLSGNTLTPTPLGFNSYSGYYQNVYPGSRQVAAYDYPNNSALVTPTFNFEVDKYYSLFVVGAGSNYRNVVSVDNLDSLAFSAGNAYVRYVNAITDSVNTPMVTIKGGGNNIVNENAAYANVSAFKVIPAGSVDVAVKNGGNIDASRTITLEQNKIYTVLLSGTPGASDEAKKVQIKFIQNGTLTEDDK